MKTFKVSKLMIENGWMCPAFVETDERGTIRSVKGSCSGASENLAVWAMPKIPSAHSHAFQFAMAGKAEFLPKEAKGDDFWSWRKAMYDLALTITPEQMEDISTRLFTRMLEQGFGSVGEFHYLHHQPDGSYYGNPTEMAERILEAAKKTGMRVTLVPVHYQTGNFGEKASERQRRFLFKDADAYLKYLDALKAKIKKYPNARLGLGVHSLRAAPREAIREILENGDKNAPFHIHASEQTKEVDDCLAFYGRRPVAWVLENFEVNERFHFVHATHIDAGEMRGLIQTKANVVLCPTTEGNLGDGIFPLKDYHLGGGRWCIGSDSHVCQNPFEELRWLDYAQRLTHRIRNPLCTPGGPDSGEELLRQALVNGASALSEEPFSYAGKNLSELCFFDCTPGESVFSGAGPKIVGRFDSVTCQ